MQDSVEHTQPVAVTSNVSSAPRLLKTGEAAARIGKSKSWLDQSRGTGTGPRYLKIGAGVFYRLEDIDTFLEQQVRTSVYNFDEVAR